ncbi:hypothetical protein ACIQVO_38625 [Streptomyces sp. NPDC101062]|uniref:hypothetical protein n=1 Tax=unclassified Streptomyces TaxID=2593676 RepID=UPI0038075796
MELPEIPAADAEPGDLYVLKGKLMFMPGSPSIRCVVRNQNRTRCVTKLPGLSTWGEALLGFPTGSGLLWVRATRVPDVLADQYAVQHCTRHHTAAAPLVDDISPEWEEFDAHRHPGARALSLPRGQWTALPFDVVQGADT